MCLGQMDLPNSENTINIQNRKQPECKLLTFQSKNIKMKKAKSIALPQKAKFLFIPEKNICNRFAVSLRCRTLQQLQSQTDAYIIRARAGFSMAVYSFYSDIFSRNFQCCIPSVIHNRETAQMNT